MQHDHIVSILSNIGHVESSDHRRTNQATTKAREDQELRNPCGSFALLDQSVDTTVTRSCLLVLVQVELQMERDGKCLTI
jgi:hypothetical protein